MSTKSKRQTAATTAQSTSKVPQTLVWRRKGNEWIAGKYRITNEIDPEFPNLYLRSDLGLLAVWGYDNSGKSPRYSLEKILLKAKARAERDANKRAKLSAAAKSRAVRVKKALALLGAES